MNHKALAQGEVTFKSSLIVAWSIERQRGQYLR
jgi:hypothetical protein